MGSVNPTKLCHNALFSKSLIYWPFYCITSKPIRLGYCCYLLVLAIAIQYQSCKQEREKPSTGHFEPLTHCTKVLFDLELTVVGKLKRIQLFIVQCFVWVGLSTTQQLTLVSSSISTEIPALKHRKTSLCLTSYLDECQMDPSLFLLFVVCTSNDEKVGNNVMSLYCSWPFVLECMETHDRPLTSFRGLRHG